MDRKLFLRGKNMKRQEIESWEKGRLPTVFHDHCHRKALVQNAKLAGALSCIEVDRQGAVSIVTKIT
jgi:hypothetical protein